MRSRRLLALVMLLLMAGLVTAGVQVRHSKIVTTSFEITDTGDTAQIIRLNQFTAKDSFTYNGDIEGYGDGAYPGLGAEDSAYSWIGPPMIVRLDITSPIDSTAVYACTLDGGTNVFGFTYDPPGIDTTVATFSAAIVDSINEVAGIKDTVQGEDSIANGYVLVRWLIAQNDLEGDTRGVIRVEDDQAGGQLAIGDSTLVTVAMVCDSMAATINALDSIGDRLTAANSGDTVITLTSDKKGMAFTVDIADAEMDTNYTTANKNSYSTHTDTFRIVQLNIGPDNATGMIFKAIIKASEDTLRGLGGLDSGFLVLYTVFDGEYFALAGETAATVPCTLWYPLTTSTAGTDTLLKEQLFLEVRISDSASDTTGYWPTWETEIDYNIW